MRSPESRSLTEWAVHLNPYAAPEVNSALLSGVLSTGKRVQTSRVVEVLSDRTCRTETGSVYRLDGPHHPEDQSDEEHPLEVVAKCLSIQATLAAEQRKDPE